MSPTRPQRTDAAWRRVCLLAGAAAFAVGCNVPTVQEVPHDDGGDDGGDGSEPCRNTEDCGGSACIGGRCRDAGGLCGSGATLGDADSDRCVTNYCCEALETCTFGFSDYEGCNACVTSNGGSRCDAYLACLRESCAAPWPVCDSGLSVDQETAASCLAERCCAEMTTCASAGIDECVACFEAGSGPPCDAAVRCARERCLLGL